MPNARKKKAAKNEDFKKKKLKIGKKKALPDNFTDTSFHSKSISLPNQSITEDKSKQVTTRRNLTLTDLVTQVKHYSPGVRKDAILGLQELCATHPGTLNVSLGIVVNGILKLFVDDDREVRKALLSFLQESMPTIDKVNLAPFLPLLVMYTCSAMSHIFEDVRLDAVKLMDLWVNLASAAVVDKFWNKIVGIYTSLLMVNSANASPATGATNTGTKITNIGSAKVAAARSHLHLHKSKLGLLSSLSRFLEAGLSRNRREHMWFLLGSLDNKRARETFKKQLQRLKSSRDSNVIKCQTPSKASCYLTHSAADSIIPYLSSSNLQTLNLFESSGPKNQEINQSFSSSSTTLKTNGTADDFNVQKLIETFQPVLVSTWLETAPSVFSATNSITLTPALELLQVVLKLTLVLWRALVSGDEINQVDSVWIEKNCYQLLKHFTVYFPYGADILGDGGAKADAVLREMNIATCELTSLLLLAKTTYIQKQQPVTGQKRRRQQQHQNNGSEGINAELTEKIVDHVLSVLGSQDKNGGKMTSISANFKENDLNTLLPAVWGFMNSLDSEYQFEIFKTFINYYHQCNVNSSLKRIALEFLSSVYLIQSNPSYNGRFHLDTPEYENLVQGWFRTLPKTLWQLKTNHIETTRIIINIMCEIAKRDTKDIFNKESLLATEMAMVPFFHVHLASKGSLFGPFISLPKDIQNRALEFLYYVDSGSEKIAKALSECKIRQEISV